VKAWVIDSFDGIQGLRLAGLPEPTPGPGEAVVEMVLAGLNPADRYLAGGEYPAKPTFPHILGRDGLGTVVAVAPGVQDVSVGERVVIVRSEIGVNRAGTFAQRVAVPVESLVDAPDGWTDEEAAGAVLVYLTAFQALTQWDDLGGDLPPSVVLVTGASGGVGVATVQLAVAMGHRVVGLSRDPQKRQKLIGLGATACFDPADKWVDRLKSDKTPVDLAVDNVGGAGFTDVIASLGHGGRVSVVGRLAGPVPQFNTSSLFFRRIRIGGVAVGDYTPAQSRAAWGLVANILDDAKVRPVVDSVHPFDQLPAAFERLHAGPMGKVLLRLQSSQ
jgi:NADPH2:quinone reductase